MPVCSIFWEVNRMLETREAVRIGINACIDRIGREFCTLHADNTVSAYEETKGGVNCFIGLNEEPSQDYDLENVQELVLSNATDWKYTAECFVNYQDGNVVFV